MKERRSKWIYLALCFICFTGVLIGHPLQAKAAPDKAGTDYSAVFDYRIYLQMNPDLKTAYASRLNGKASHDEAILLDHFISCGMKEGRCASATFDAKSYAKYNEDLVALYGTSDYTPYYIQYMQSGINENRRAVENIGAQLANGVQAESVTIWGNTYRHIQTTANGVYIYGGDVKWPQYVLDAIDAAGVLPTDGAYDRVLKIYTYVGKNTIYDKEASKKLCVNSYALTTKTTLTTHKAVCQGMANACQSMALACGIETYITNGIGPSHNPVGHGWNVSVINGTEYWYDANYYARMTRNGIGLSDRQTFINCDYQPNDEKYYWLEWNMGDTWKIRSDGTHEYQIDQI